MPRKGSSRPPELRAPNAPSSAYDIGYQKPPKHKQFKPGQSGNPNGRPKGARNKSNVTSERSLRNLVLAEANRKIDVREGDKTVSYSVIKAVVRSLGLQAARGKLQSQKLFIELNRQARQEESRELQAWFEVACEYKYGWEERIEHARQNNLPIPNPIPHPDDIDIDPRTGTVKFRGPVTQKEKEFYDFLRDRENVLQEAVESLEGEVQSAVDAQSRAELEAELRKAEKMLEETQDTIRAFRGDPDPIDDVLEARRRAKKLLAELRKNEK